MLTSGLALPDLDMQQIVDDPAAIQDAHQLVTRRLRNYRTT